MEYLIENKTGLKYFPGPRFSIDGIFQMSNRPCDNIRENKLYFSEKQHLYRLKSEASVPSNSISINFKSYSPRSISNITCFQKYILGIDFLLKNWATKNNHWMHRVKFLKRSQIIESDQSFVN